MDPFRVVNILENEKACVLRADHDNCNRDCAKCDLLMDTQEILEAYRIAIACVKKVFIDYCEE